MGTDISPLPQECDFDATITSLTARFVRSWQTTPATPPDTMRTYSRRQQALNEQRILKVVDDPKRRRELRTLLDRPGEVTGSTLRRLAIVSLFTEADQEESFNTRSQQFTDATAEFATQARQFDPGIASRHLAQALRNLWVFCTFQYLSGLEIRVTPSALAYSLLYPYTDNYLDDAGLSLQAKKEFGSRVGVELREPGQVPLDHREELIFSLLEMINREHPRARCPLIHKSLQAIHTAQSRALAQQDGVAERDVLPLSFEKGGTSVLVDAFLAGSVTNCVWLELAFGFGCVLQLIDDLQDAEVDYEKGHRTHFSIRNYATQLETESLHLLRFLNDLIASWQIEASDGLGSFKSMMTESCSFLIHEALARTHVPLSAAFIARMNRHAPVSMRFLGGLRERVRN
ncbi:MAG: hypothetical protein IT282_09050 [Bacteroidetes bacterium]|nr:hypothetical protein [Bacteroidota bacterium]